MTYCIGIMLDTGMIFASDSRTNAGMDNIAPLLQDDRVRAPRRPRDRPAELRQPRRNAGGDRRAQPALRRRRRRRQPLERADDVRRRDAGRRRDARHRAARRRLPAGERGRLQCLVHRRRADRRRAVAAVPDLRRRQLHRGGNRHALLPDRRNQVRQADHRPRDHAAHAACGRREVRPGVIRFDDAQQPVGRACRSTSSATSATASKCPSGGDSTTATPISPRSATNGAKARDRSFGSCPSCAGDRRRR